MSKNINNSKFLYGIKGKKIKSGIGLVEVLIAVSIFSVILGALIVASNMYLTGAGDNLKSAKAAYLTEEGIEAVKIIRDKGWINISSLSTSTDYYFTFNTTTSMYGTTTLPVIVDSFIRKFRVSDVFRDINGKIVISGGTLDTKSKKLTVTTSWLSKTGTTTKSLSTYIADILGN